MVASHAERLQHAWTALSGHLGKHRECERSYRKDGSMACGEGLELLRSYRYELVSELERQRGESVSSDEVIEVHERLERLETLDDLLGGER